MLVNIVSLLVLIALVVLFASLARRAWRSRNAFVKWIGVIVAGLLTSILTLVTILAIVGLVKFNAALANPVPNVKVAASADQIAHGQKIINQCGCHTMSGAPPLAGGNESFAPPPLGTLYAVNLTPVEPLKDWSDGEIIRAIREGVHKNGRALYVMPSGAFHNFSDDDVQAIVAYLRSQPPVQHDTPDNNLTVLGLALVASGVFANSAQPPITQPVVAPPAGTAERGKYFVDTFACRDCHGENLAGGTPGGFAPVGPNLTPIMPKWSDADFLKMIRTGVDPSGHALDPSTMPWKEISARYADDELKDMYTYLHGLTPIQK